MGNTQDCSNSKCNPLFSEPIEDDKKVELSLVWGGGGQVEHQPSGVHSSSTCPVGWSDFHFSQFFEMGIWLSIGYIFLS